MPKKKKKKKRPARLTAAQVKIAGQFNNYSSENPTLSFAETLPKQLLSQLL